MEPQEILEKTRELIRQYSQGDEDKWFYGNRFVFARLALDERKTKTEIKKALLGSGAKCHLCGEEFEFRKNVHLHRIEDAKGYTKANCSLMHPTCHEKHHAEHARRAYEGGNGNVMRKESSLYDGSFLYWWDISSNNREDLDSYDAVEFMQKDTGRVCRIPAAAIKGFLTEARKTSRRNMPWGIKVFKERPNELAFDPGGDKKEKWLFLPVIRSL
jgi:hypothetical protein